MSAVPHIVTHSRLDRRSRRVPKATPAFRFVDLFAGLGGFHVALRELGGRGVFAAEWEPALNALYEANFGIPAWTDINDLDSDDTIRSQVPDHEVLTAGFPCQPFSKAGEQLGFEHTLQGHLFFHVLDILRVKRPQRFILENVPNILYHRGGRTKGTIVEELQRLGYQVKVERLSPHQFGVPQVRERAYFVGSLDGLRDFTWPAKHKEPTDITSVLRRDIDNPRAISELTLRAIEMWGDFLRRSPESVKLPSFPIWSMEFGATYPYAEETPPAIWNRRKARGLDGLGLRGNFGFKLDGLSISEQFEMLPSHSRRDGDIEFPHWKKMFIRQNREFYAENEKWINPWLRKWKPWEFFSSFQKFEWNAQGEERNIDKYVLQVRASGIRVKRTSTAPSLIAMTQTQIPILGAEIVGHRRYVTPEECAKLQSLDGIALPDHDLAAYRALGNAVNANVIKAIAEPLLVGLAKPASAARKRRPAA
jgi:DNA (cytosine-5)-methyltransferase 1